jgi:hypothetical protein
MDYIKYVNWPKVPDSILNNIPKNDSNYQIKFNYSTFNWSESNNEELDKWCKQIISKDLYYAFSLTKGDLLLHKDVHTILKLNYVINPGGENVVTRFWDDNKKDLLAEYVIEPHRWHIFNSNTFHSVHGIEKNQTRFSVTAQIF